MYPIFKVLKGPGVRNIDFIFSSKICSRGMAQKKNRIFASGLETNGEGVGSAAIGLKKRR